MTSSLPPLDQPVAIAMLPTLVSVLPCRVVVLSNNDGCAIARSNEAKALGIKMGAPWFQIRHFEESDGLVTSLTTTIVTPDFLPTVLEEKGQLVARRSAHPVDFTRLIHTLACRNLVLIVFKRVFPMHAS